MRLGVILSVFFVGFASACDTPATVDGGLDASQPAVDTGVPADTGTIPDTGTPGDACPIHDMDDDGQESSVCGGTDCDDGDATRFEDATEICDSDDEDCDPTTLGPDRDGDGDPALACCNGAVCGTDCDDDNVEVHEGATEVCNGRDEDCDGDVDEDATSTNYYADCDGDGHGAVGGTPIVACAPPPVAPPECGAAPLAQYVSNATDCDDTRGSVNPGVAEACNGLDDDCNGTEDDGAALTACALAHASAACVAGACAIVTCDAGYDDCDTTDPNGCEQPLNTTSDCAGCGVGCELAHATESCSTGACEIVSCDDHFEDCDGSPANGCERATNTLTDCGGCDLACSRSNAVTSCSTGACELIECVPGSGYGNCDSEPGDGCEQPLTTPAHCGGCGVECDPAHAVESCATGSCTFSRCDAGWCDGTSGQPGCETDIDNDPSCTGSSLPIEIDVDGDSADTTNLTHSGSGEQWFRVIVRESNTDTAGDPQCDNLGTRLRITNTFGTTYTMNVYCASCTATPHYVGLGTLSIGRRDPPTCALTGADTVDNLTLYVQVEYAVSVNTACGMWTVTAEPDIQTGVTYCS